MHLHCGAIDFRKSINGLAAVVEHELGLNAFANAVFVFANRRRDRIKILGWDVNGFWLLHKRLESERFVWPRAQQEVIELTVQQLDWLLQGIDIQAIQTHRALRLKHAA